MEFSVRSFAVVALLMLVSLSTDMRGPLVVNAIGCDPQLCEAYCSGLGLPWCCSGLYGPCLCQGPCPRAGSVKNEITKEVMADATVKEPFIKEIVIA